MSSKTQGCCREFEACTHFSRHSEKNQQHFLKEVSQFLVLTEASTGQSANGFHELRGIHPEEDQGMGAGC